MFNESVIKYYYYYYYYYYKNIHLSYLCYVVSNLQFVCMSTCIDGVGRCVTESFQQVGLDVSVHIQLLHVLGAIISGSQVRTELISSV